MDQLRNFDEFTEWDDSREIKIQCLSWNGDNEFIEDEQHSNDKKTIYNLEHTIKIYGVNQFGNSVSVNILHFKPYFYIKVNDDCSVKEKNEILKKIKEDMKPFIADGILSATILKRKEFYGFTNKKDFTFIKFTFRNLLSMKKCESVIREGLPFGKDLRKYPLYESNILPFMRFMHEKNLEAAGWIKIPPFKYTMFEGTEKRSNCQIDIQTDWENVEFYQNKNMAPFLIASYDIECNSSHGDFPMAKKNYKKLGYEIYDAFNNIRKSASPKEFTQLVKKEALKAMLWKAFSNDNKITASEIYDQSKL